MAFKRVLGKKLKNYFIIGLDYSISNSYKLSSFRMSSLCHCLDQLKTELIHQSIPFQLVRLENFARSRGSRS
jgi:hypothetical protein